MGGLLAFRVGNYENTAEREQFRSLCAKLSNHYKHSNEFCVFVGNYNIGCELDALLIKSDAIIAIEFKNYGGHVIATENGQWTADGLAIKGGSRKTVLQQAKTNHSILKRELGALGIDPRQIKDVPTVVVFHQPVVLESKLTGTTKSWLHVTDDDHFLNKIDDIVSPNTDLSPLDIVNIAELLGLNEFYLDEFSNANYDKPAPNDDYIEVFDDIKKYETVDKEIGQNEGEEENMEEINLDAFTIEDEDSITLTEFVKKVVKLSLKLEDFTVKVLDGDKASLSFGTYGITLTRKYVVTINAYGISEHCNKLTKFTNHVVKAITPSTIFWEEGEELLTADTSSISVHESHQTDRPENNNLNVTFRKSKTILPHWLDKKIFNEHNAIYAPEHERYEYNLDLNAEELNVYLGTYFPRSYAEMFCIVDNLMQNKVFAEIIQGEEQINIFDCGCGTGGEIIGLITALAKHLPQVNVNVTAVDGNEGALAILRELVEKNPSRNVHANLTTLCQTFNSTEDIAKLANGKKNYHFLLCDKMVCELISKQVLSNDAYAIMARMLVSHLHEKGLLIMLDVTSKDEHTGLFYPQLMNNSINEYVRKSRTIETLLPLSCACNEGCKYLCFMQQTFSVSHSHKTADESRVCYRVLCRKPLKETILKEVNAEGVAHVIHPMKYKQNDESALCRQSKDNKIIIDSFNINL